MPPIPQDTRLPPQNIEAEQSLLGALLIDKDAIIKIADSLYKEDFYDPRHSTIYEAMLALYARQEPIDLLSLVNQLEESGTLDVVGGRAYLTSLTTIVPTAAHVTNYSQIIQKKASLRRLIQATAIINEMAFSQQDDVESIMDAAEKQLFSVSQKFQREIFIPIKDILDGAFERIDEIHHHQGRLRGITSGFQSIDGYLAGFQKSDLIILAARPSVGKTALALDFARNAAKGSNMPIAIFSLEMSKEILVDRLLCSEAKVDLWKMRTGRLSEEDFPRLGNAMGTLSDLPIYIDDSGTVNVMELRTKARRLQAESNLGMIIIDYLQLMEGRGRSESRVQEITEISRALKQLAREIDVPILALSQLSRAVESRTPAIPKLSDLRESGSIEQDADVVLFIYRKAADTNFRDLSIEEENSTQLYIAKHRNGPVGKIELIFDKRFASFSDLARDQDLLSQENIDQKIPDIEF